MEMTLHRISCGPTCTIGQLYIDGYPACYTLEDVVRPDGVKVYGETAIPYGRYQVVITPSQRFKRDLPLLLNVPMFEGIRIHPGNTAEDTHGCILPGMQRDGDKVLHSKAAFDGIFAEIREALDEGHEVWIEITDRPLPDA